MSFFWVWIICILITHVAAWFAGYKFGYVNGEGKALKGVLSDIREVLDD